MRGSDALTGPVGERFRVGRVVARSFAIWGRELPLLLVLALVVHAPRVVSMECLDRAMPEFPQVEPGAARPGDTDARWEGFKEWLWRAVPILSASSILRALFTDLSLALVIFAVCARLGGRQAGFGESVRGGFRRFLPVLSVSLRLFLFREALFLGAVLVLMLVLWQLILAGPIASAALALALRFPTSVLVTLLLSSFWVAVPAAVVEPSWGPLRRSRRLTRGHRPAICGILLLLHAIDWGSSQLLRLGVRSVDLPWLARKGIWWTQDLLVVSLTAVFAAVGYHALRLEKEGVDVSDIERVFA